MHSFYLFLWIFFIYSFLGWCLEVCFFALNTGKFVNRGFLNGPVCPIYGFGVVIVANALHIVPEPEKALAEIRRVLKDDGVLIAPTFTHAGSSVSGKAKAFFMSMAGFPLHSRWTSEEYLRFLRQNGWAVQKSAVLKASFPLTYAECTKSEGPDVVL